MSGVRRALMALVIGVLGAGVALPAAMPALVVRASHTAGPSSVTIAGSLQDELGCTGDWQPDCATTHLTYDSNDQVWQGAFTVPAGTWEYKAALNNSWDENYGANATFNGGNLSFTVASPTVVKFYYDHATHWVADKVGARIVIAPGDFQSELGCSGDWDPGCLRSWLQDPDGNGTYTFSTTALDAGSYETKAVINEEWTENYGNPNGNTPGGANIPFSVPSDGTAVTFSFVSGTNTLSVQIGSSAGHDNDIWWDDLGHDSRDALYRAPTGAVPTGTPVTLRLRAASGDLTAARIRLWNDRTNAQSIVNMSAAADDGTHEWWEATVPPSNEPTIYWYRFIAVDGSATAYYEDDAARTGGWGEPFASSPDYGWQLTVHDPAFSTPDWVKNAVIYQIFPDRFRDGDPTNNTPAGEFFYEEATTIVRSGTTNWNQPICDPREAGGSCPGVYSQNFYGGDLAGIQNKLDYLEDLGVTAIYLNPIFDSPSNHKYDTTDFSTIDPAFGNTTLLSSLVADMSGRGMHLILDGVFNHTSSDSIYFDRYGRYASLGACEDEASAYRDWYHFTDVAPGTGECVSSTGVADGATYESWFGFDSLPKLNSANQEVRDLFYAGAVNPIGPYWLTWADGWRLDVGGDVDPGVTNNPSNDFWEGFRDAVRSADSDAYIVGEEWGNATPWTLGPEWDATMNYQLSSALLSLYRDETFVDNDHNSASSAGVLAPITPEQFAERVLNLQERYPAEAFAALMNLLGSHDTNRPLFMLDHNADQNNGALYENPAYDWSDAIDRLKGVVVLQATLPGAPTIYYGDEVGLVGPSTYDGSTWQDDPYNRIPYPWLDETGTPFYSHLQTEGGQADLLDHYTTVFGARNGHEALRTGDLRFLLTDNAAQTLAYGRKSADGTDAAVVVVNRSDSAASVEVDALGYLPAGGQFIDVLNANAPYAVTPGGAITLNVPANGESLLVSSSALAAGPQAVMDLDATSAGSGAIELSWTSIGGSTVEVYRSLLSGGGYELVTTLTAGASGLTETYSDSGLTTGTTYHYVVVTRDANGLVSENSNEASATPGFDLSNAGTSWFNLQWPPSITHTISTTDRTDDIYAQIWIDGVTSASAAAIDGIRAQVGFGPDGTQPDTAWSWTEMAFASNQGNNDEYVSSLLPDELGNFDYAVRWSGDGGLTWFLADLNGPQRDGTLENPGALTVNAAPDATPPSTPTLSLDGLDGSSIDLSWTASTDESGLAGYELFRDGIEIASLDASTTTYSDESVTTGETYAYTVVAFDTSFNRSAPSNEVEATAQNRSVEVTFTVAVPEFTPDDATVYVTGSIDELGPWNPSANPMTDNGDGTWSRTFTIPDGTSLEWKYTRGSWETVENWGSITGVVNRGPVLIDYGTDGTQTIDNTGTTGAESEWAVQNWRDPLVTFHTPADGATGVDASSAVVLVWSRAMNTASAAITVTGPGGAVAGTLSFSTTAVANDTWTFTPDSALAAGEHNASVSNQQDVEGNVQQVATQFSFTVAGDEGDLLAPIVDDVAVVLLEGGQVNTAPVLLSWSAADDVSADASLVHQVQFRRLVDGSWGPWKDGGSVSGVEESARILPTWREFQYRVRSRDEAMNWSDWAESNTILSLRRQERHFTRSAGWTVVSMSGAMKGRVALSSTPGATAQLAFTGNGVAAVMPVSAGQGIVEICVDASTPSATCKTVNLATFTPSGKRRLVAAFTQLSSGSHVLRVTVVSGTVRLDGALFSK
ncbi:MAG TPA: alpha-amylase family glycosyl hydrolase [Candidatus Limnocylindrales bacterium]|nr:alpha-amylase family glycosyl hydrolase [Candidatus Limnocylindrales bacterium]